MSNDLEIGQTVYSRSICELYRGTGKVKEAFMEYRAGKGEYFICVLLGVLKRDKPTITAAGLSDRLAYCGLYHDKDIAKALGVKQLQKLIKYMDKKYGA